ncbi:hypothetical protein BHM03_00008694 [Ensete ventricosum]|nr:hypothetical protein BHM03_00008694 [Ensete ventricosum]
MRLYQRGASYDPGVSLPPVPRQPCTGWCTGASLAQSLAESFELRWDSFVDSDNVLNGKSVASTLQAVMEPFDFTSFWGCPYSMNYSQYLPIISLQLHR